MVEVMQKTDTNTQRFVKIRQKVGHLLSVHYIYDGQKRNHGLTWLFMQVWLIFAYKLGRIFSQAGKSVIIAVAQMLSL